MKLFRFGDEGSEKPGLILSDGRRIDASGFGEDYNEAFFGGGGLERLAAWAEANAGQASDVGAEIRFGPAVCRPSKIVCIGLNFQDHADETGAVPPAEPVIFFKATSAWCGPNDEVIIPRASECADWEVELAFVIGKRASYVAESDAPSHIAGYALMNDYSEREFQKEHCGQWVKGKSADHFAPFGPFLATPDELADAGNLAMKLTVNGVSKQESNTRHMIFKPAFLVSYLSRFMTLLPGDVISTGTPGGVGMGFDPPQYLRPGDVVELEIEGLGSSRQVAVAAG